MNVQTLEQRIKDRARQEAKNEARRAIEELPRFGDVRIQVEIKCPTQEAPWASKTEVVTIDSYRIRVTLQGAIEEYIYANRVEELAQKLLSAVDQIEELSAVVDNIQSEVSRG